MTKRKHLQDLLVIRCPPDEATLRRQCEVEHRSIAELTRVYGYTDVSNLYVFCRRWGIKTFRPQSFDWLREVAFTPLQHQVVLGTVLGDGSISTKRNGSGWLRLAQGEKQLDYLLWKKRFLEPFIRATEPSRQAQLGFSVGRYRYSFNSIVHPTLTEYRKLFYPDGKKHITQNILDRLGPVALAFWVMDDGGGHKSNITLSTNAFAREEVELAGEWLSDLLHDHARVRCQSAQRSDEYVIRLNSRGARTLSEMIRPHFCASLLYKLDKVGPSATRRGHFCPPLPLSSGDQTIPSPGPAGAPYLVVEP